MIRPATPCDEKRIHELVEKLQHGPIDFEAFSRVYRYNLESKDVYYLVFEDNGDVIGFISLHIQPLLHHAANVAEIQELFVDEASRGLGIGRELFTRALGIAKSRDCGQIEVCTRSVGEARAQARAFYRAMGMSSDHYKFVMAIGGEGDM